MYRTLSLGICRGFFVFGSTTPVAMAGSADGAGFINLPEREEIRMPPMPDKPDTWAQIWLALSNPLWQGAIMAVTITLLRVLYEAKEPNKWRIILEALICGALSLSASSIIEWMTWPPSLSVAAGGAIGFIGVTAIRDMIIRFLGKKVDSA